MWKTGDKGKRICVILDDVSSGKLKTKIENEDGVFS